MARIKKVLIVGLGRFGAAVADTLWKRGADVTVIDSEAAIVDTVKGRSHAAFVADGTDPSVLESVGARGMDAAVITFGEAFESAVLTVATVKAMGVPMIVARATTTRRADVLRAVGATRVLEIEHEMGVRAAQELVTPSANDLLTLASQYRVVPWPASGDFVGRSLKDSGLRQRYGVNVIGVRSQGDKGDKLKVPSPDYTIKKGDICLIVAEDSDMQRFVESSDG